MGIVGIVGIEENSQNNKQKPAESECEFETDNVEEVIDFYYTMKGLLLQNQMASHQEYPIPIETLYPISQPIPIPIPISITKNTNDTFYRNHYVKPIASSYHCDVYNLPQLPRRMRE